MAKDRTSDTPENVQEQTNPDGVAPQNNQDALAATDASTSHDPVSDQAQLDARTDNSGEPADLHPVLGNPKNPATEPQPDVDGISDSVPQNAAQVGTATDLNAFRQELEDEVSKAVNAVNEIADKARKYVDRFQNQQS